MQIEEWGRGNYRKKNNSESMPKTSATKSIFTVMIDESLSA
jgi:hypothetical protein